MRNSVVHAALMASSLVLLVAGVLRTGDAANAADSECAGIERDVAPFETATLPIGLLYRRAFFGDDRFDGPTSSLVGAHVRAEAPRPGSGVAISAAAGARLELAPERAVPIGAASRMRLSIASEAPTRIELELGDPVSGTRLFRALDVAAGEQTIDVRLTDLRYARGAIPRLDRARTWALRFVDDAEVELRAFELWRDDDDDAATRELDALREDFDDPSIVSTFHRGPFVILSDAPRLEPEAVFDALDRMHDDTRALLPNMPVATRPIPLLVFVDAHEYERFWKRFSARVGADIGPRPGDEGLAWLGVATASFSAEWAEVRPTFVHEAHHALLERSYGLSAGRSWILEGLAILAQLEVSGQDLAPVYRRGLQRRHAPQSLHALVNGTPIDTEDYWQVALLAEWLTSDPDRRAALDAAMSEMAARGDTDLRPIATRYFGAELGVVTSEFWSWAWLAHGA